MGLIPTCFVRRFSGWHGDVRNIHNGRADISNSDRDYVKESNKIVVGAKIESETHRYGSNWVIANFRIDILLEMLWQHKASPTTNYTTKKVAGDDVNLTSFHVSHTRAKVTNLGVKRFCSMLPEKKKKIWMIFRFSSQQRFPIAERCINFCTYQAVRQKGIGTNRTT